MTVSLAKSCTVFLVAAPQGKRTTGAEERLVRNQWTSLYKRLSRKTPGSPMSKLPNKFLSNARSSMPSACTGPMAEGQVGSILRTYERTGGYWLNPNEANLCCKPATQTKTTGTVCAMS